MKRHHFTTIEEVKKANLLLKKAVKIATRKERFYDIELFQLEVGYMEVYRHEHFNVIIKATHFTELSFLDPYLDLISLDFLKL